MLLEIVNNFGGLDWAIVAVYMVIATIPGFLCARFISGQESFLIAGRTLSVFLATATLTATETGLITVMYWAEFGYTAGFSAMTMGVIALIATLFVGLTGFMVAGLRASGATTVAEYYEIRYNRKVRVLGGCIIALAGILNYGVFLRIEAEFVRIISGIGTANLAAGEIDPVVKLVMSILVVIVLAYTLLGGMVSVVLTDFIQFIVMTVGLGLTTWWAMTHPSVGGFRGMLEAVNTHRPGYGINPFETQVGPGGVVLGLGLLWIIWQSMHWLGVNTWQTGAFRTAATDSPRTAKTMWTLTAFNYFGRGTIPMIWGIAALAYLGNTGGAERVAGMNTQLAMPIFLAEILPTGMIGLLLAAMLAALMSTHASYLLAWSGVLTEDIAVPLLRRVFGIEVSPNSRIWITRFFIVCLGAFLILYGLWFKVKQTIWGYLAVTGTMYVAGSTCLLAMGLYWRRANATGAFLGIICGAAPGLLYLFCRMSVLFLGAGTPTVIAKINSAMSDPVTGAISFPLALLGMIVGSLLSGQTAEGRSGFPIAESNTGGPRA